MLGRKADIKVGGDFGTVPADKYTVQIADVNFKTMFNKFKGEEEERLNFKYVILDDKPMHEDDDGSTRGRFLWHAVTQSLSTRSWLMKLAKAAYGRDLTKEELDRESPKFFDPEGLIGMQVDVMVTEDPNKDNTAVFNNVTAYSKTRTKLDPVDVERAEQTVVEDASQPAVPVADTPNLNPELDNFLDGLEDAGDKEEKAEETVKAPEKTVEELEAELKAAKAATKKAKEAKK